VLTLLCRSPIFHAAGVPPPRLPDSLDPFSITQALSSLSSTASAALKATGAPLGLVNSVAAAGQERSAKADSPEVRPESSKLAAAVAAAAAAAASARMPFEWNDGPLVVAMKTGGMLLIDEINLADDAVLERLNSVLEPARTLMLAEKGGAVSDVIRGHKDFRIVATMNPGGDHGKRELSPALSNRLTQVGFLGGGLLMRPDGP
jgi:hypothetical protein